MLPLTLQQSTFCSNDIIGIKEIIVTFINTHTITGFYRGRGLYVCMFNVRSSATFVLATYKITFRLREA